MKKFALATATALTLAMGANVAFAQTSQAPMTLAAGEMTKAKESTSDTWITTKVKADLLTEKGIPGSDIKVETNKGVVSLSSDVAISDSQKATAVAITKKIKGVKAVSADGLLAGGAVKADNIDKAKEGTSDTWITTKVKADLVTEKGIPGTDINVETNKGVVSLSSTAAVTEAQKTTAVNITKKIKGVTAVSADGLLAGGAVKADNIDKAKEGTTDTWITTKVKADLVTEKGIPGTDIKVETNKGVVSLSSTVAVTDAQKEMAVAITKKIKGVKAVSADGLKAE